MNKISAILISTALLFYSEISNAQFYSGGGSVSVYKTFGIGLMNPGLNLNYIIHSERKPKNGFGMDYNYYAPGKYEYMAKPRPIFPNTPEITVNAEATVSFQTFDIYFFKYLKGNMDEKFNLYMKINFGFIAGSYSIDYEPYDTYQYDFATIESEKGTEPEHPGSGDGFIGLTFGFEKRINDLRVYFEFAYNRAVFTPIFGLYNDASYQPFGNYNMLKLNIGLRKRLFLTVNVDQ